MEEAEAAVAEAMHALRKMRRSFRVDDQEEPPESVSLFPSPHHPIPPSHDIAKPSPPASCRPPAMEEAAEEAMHALADAMYAIKKMRTIGVGGLDFISRLPDAVLGTIISLLPTKDGARTQAISRRWLPLWRSAPLNLVVDRDLSTENHKLVALVSKILYEHPGPARCFSLSNVVPPDSLDEIDGWLHSQALSNLQELKLRITAYPLSVLRFASTLRVAEFRSCHFPNLIAPPSLNFPHLKQLTLYDIIISEDTLHSMLSGCTALESLLLQRIYNQIGRLCITSRTLRSIGFCAYCDTFHELVIKDAPCLERLLPLYPDFGPLTIRVIWAPKLAIMGLLSKGIFKLHLGITVFQKMTAVSLITKLHSMKVLALDSIGPNLDAVIGFLKCFPCLERLYVISHPQKDMNNVQKYDPLDPIECLELHLKKVLLKNYDGTKRPAVNFAKFFVLNAKVLKEMEIGLLNNRNETWMANQRRQLKVENRASRDARIELKSGPRECFTSYREHIHDMSMADPFDASTV